MKLHLILYALLIGLCGVLVTVFLSGEVPYVEDVPEGGGDLVRTYMGHGFAHPEVPAMDVGGDGYARHYHLLGLGWVFAMLQVGFFLTCLAFGARKGGKVGPFAKPILIGGIGYVAIFTALFRTYEHYAATSDDSLFLALPIPTAWMIYGVWIFPLCYMFLYMFLFDSWTFTEEDQAEFDRIVAKRRAYEARCAREAGEA